MRRFRRSWAAQLLMLLVVATGLYFGFSFAREVVQAQQLASQATASRQENAKLAAENRKAARDLKYYQSDAYAELRARTDLNMRRPNELILVPVVPVGDPNGAATAGTGQSSVAVAAAPARPAARPTDTSSRNWDRWLSLFAGGNSR